MRHNTPAIKELRQLFIFLKSTIDDDFAPEGWEESYPAMEVTIGWNPTTGKWNYQTGDNSFTGGAYGFPVWAVVTLTRRSNSKQLAHEAIYQLMEYDA